MKKEPTALTKVKNEIKKLTVTGVDGGKRNNILSKNT